MSRQRLDMAAFSARRGGEHGVHHREAGADQEQPFAVSGRGRQGPRVFDIARVPGERLRDAETTGRRVADGEHHLVAVELGAIVEPHAERQVAPVAVYRRHARPYHVDPDVPGRRERRCLQRLLEVVAVPGARQEALGIRAGLASLHETQELERISRVGGHAAGGDVEQVREVARRKGDAATDMHAPLDEHQAGRGGRRPPQQHGRQRGAAVATAHDHDRAHQPTRR